MQVEVTFADVPPGTLEVMMSRTSPGRYAIHEFARNVYDVQIDDGAGVPLGVERPNPSQWDVTAHRGTVRVRYKVFGDHLNGTHLAIDPTHAHLNIPASLMWARGFEGACRASHVRRARRRGRSRRSCIPRPIRRRLPRATCTTWSTAR